MKELGIHHAVKYKIMIYMQRDNDSTGLMYFKEKKNPTHNIKHTDKDDTCSLLTKLPVQSTCCYKKNIMKQILLLFLDITFDN